MRSKGLVIGKLFLVTLMAGLLPCLSGIANAQPSVTAVSPATQHRSGMIEILGAGFGASGQVLVANLPAFTTTWTDTRIAAYVPEGSGLGPVDVVVENSGMSSNAGSVDVTLRQQIGRVKWRLRMDALYSSVRPARAPERAPNAGTVYAVDVYNRLYAVSPDGALLWVVLDAGDKGVSVGRDGTIYTGTNEWVKAYHPDGSLKWTFEQDPRAFVYFDTRLGLDGKIYAGNSSGMGIFALGPQGELRWVTPEPYGRPIVTYTEIAFGPGSTGDQLYFLANGHIRALRTENGTEVFTLPSLGTPVVSTYDGTVHVGASAYTPEGSLLWQFQFPFNSTSASTPAIGPNGRSYVSHLSRFLYALDPNGNELLNVSLPEYSTVLGLDPGGTQVLTTSSNTLNHIGFIEGRSATNGNRQWHLELPTEERHVDNSWTGRCGFNQYSDSRPVYTPEGATFYVMTAIATGNIVPPRGFLYAIDTDPGIPAASTILRSNAVTITAKTRRGVRTISGTVDVTDESQSAINDATIYVTWTLPSGDTVDQVHTPSSGGGKGKKGGGRGGGARFTIEDAGPGIYTLTVINMEKDGYTFDACYGVLAESVYL